MRRFLFLAAMAAVGLFTASCDDAAGPGRPTPGRFAVAPNFGKLQLDIVPIAKGRFLLTRLPGGQVALDTVVSFTPGQDSVDLAFTVPVITPGEQFNLTISLLSAANDTVFQAGPLIVTPTASNTPVPIPADFVYVGTGAKAAGVRIVTPDTSVFFGEMVTVLGEAFDSTAVAIDSTPIGWKSLDTLVATVAADAGYHGVVTGGSQRGTARIVATLITGQADTVRVKAQPVPSTIAADSGSGQVGAPASVLPQRLVARVTAADGLGVAGVWVRFAATAGGGAVSSDSVLTDSAGRAGITLTLGPTGPQSITATTPRLSTGVVFTETSVIPRATKLAIVSGNGQSGTVGTALAPLVVLATDDLDAPFAGDTVLWTVTLGNGAVVPDTSITDAGGNASTTFTLGTSAGAQRVTGRLIGSLAPEAIVAFDATGLPGAPQRLAFTVEPTATLTGTAISPPIQVSALDQYANVATGFSGQITLAILANPTGGTLSGTSAVNAASGVASFANLSINLPGTGYTLRATSGGLTPDTSAAFDISAAAGNLYWINPAGGNWSVGTNWSTGSVPTSTDTVLITLDGTYTVAVNVTASVARLIVGGTSGTQTLAITNPLTASNGGTFGTAAAVAINAGGYTSDGATSIAGSFVWAGGTLSGTGTTRVESSGSLSLTTNTKILDGTTLDLAGSGTWTGGTLSGSNGANLVIESGALLDVQNDLQFANGGGSSAPTLTNQGTLRRSTTTGNAFLDWGLTGPGRLETLSGTLQLRGGGTLVGTDSVAAGATMLLSGGTWAPSGTYHVAGLGTFQLTNATLAITAPDTVFAGTFVQTTGTLTGTGTLVPRLGFTWQGGTQSGSGKTFVPDTVALSLTTNTHILDTRTLDLAGTAAWTGGNLSGSNGANLVIESGALLDVQNDLQFANGGGSSAPTLTNQGTLRRSTTTGNAYLDWPTTVTGTLEVLTGTLQVRSSFAFTTGAILDGSGALSLASATVSAFDGIVNPGTSPGQLTIAAPTSLALGASAVVNIELGGNTAPGTDYDQLKITNQPLTLGGKLNVTLINGYTPVGGEVWPVVVGRTGTFATVVLPATQPALDTVTSNDTLYVTAGPPPTPSILFGGDSAGVSTNSGIFRVDGDGTNEIQITTDGPPAETNVHPRWSPDRNWITYTNRPNRLGPNDVYIRSADGQQVAIVVSDTSGAKPRYSPDGKHLAFECGDGGYPVTAQDVCVIPDVTNPADNMGNGSGKVYVTDAVSATLSGPGAFAWNPTNPDQLAVVRDTTGAAAGSQIWLVNYDGSGATPLGTKMIRDGAGALVQIYSMDWSPDGTFIVFEGSSGTTRSIYRIDVASGTAIQLTTNNTDRAPVISPDNTQIIFSRDSDLWYLMSMSSVGTNLVQMTPNMNFTVDQAGWDWSPDGTEIVLTEDYNANGSVFISKILSTTTATSFLSDKKAVGRRGTGGASEILDRQPSWRP